MTRTKSFLVLLTLLFYAPSVGAAVKVDTLYSSAGDRIILSYDVRRSGDKVTIQFGRAKKMLGQGHGKKYNKLDRLAVVFFDRTGGYEDFRFTGETPQAFLIPPGALYDSSEDGFFFFYDTDSPPELSFQMKEGNDFSLNIPVFLAYNEKKGHYRLISSCGDLRVSTIQRETSPRTESFTREKTSVIELEAVNDDVIKVLDCISNITRMLPEQRSLPLSESLEEDVKRLRGWKYDVSDPNLKKRINETLDAYEKTKQDLMMQEEKRKARELQQQKEQAELQARQAQEREDARIAEQKQEAEKSKKRSTWMMISGALLAILAFVGNQVLQSVRSKKSQLRMLQAQQDLSKKAEAEAKRRAQNAIRSTTRNSVNKALDSIEKKGSSLGKKKSNKKFSI